MKFELCSSSKKNNLDEIIRFLNSSAKAFYFGNNKYKDKNFDIVLKATLLSGITDLERTIRGTFDCDLIFKNVNISMLSKMFPHGVELFNVVESFDLQRLSRFLSLFRNINAHAFISDADKELFEIDYSFLNNQIVFNSRIKYYENGLTLAGLIYLLLNFLREESIANLCKKNHLFGLISKGIYGMDNGSVFVEQISHVDLEIPIRQDNVDSIFDAIVGSYREFAKISGDLFDVKIGSENYPTFKVSGSLNENLLRIDLGSLTKTCYNKDYYLTIIDEKSFIELSNNLPPFVLVDFLYQMGITTFDFSTAATIKNKYAISKLNMPKFYVDKNLSILLLPNSISDFRLISSCCRNAIGTILLSIEKYIYKTHDIKRDGKYSHIGSALSCLHIDCNVIEKITYLRNFVAHGYILEEYMHYKSERMQFKIEFIIESFKSLLDECKMNKGIYCFIVNNIEKHLINKLIGAKYKKIIEFSRIALPKYPNIDMHEFSIKCNFVNNSMFDICDFNCLTREDIPRVRVIKISLSNLNKAFYLNNVESDHKILNDFCERKGYSLVLRCDNGLLLEYELSNATRDRVRWNCV